MLKQERFQYILEKLQKQQKVLSVNLSHELNVSEDTVRRDLNELAERGQLSKVHGGALPRSPIPLSYHEREQYAQANKQEIARKAVGLLKNGQHVILDGGTITLQIARLIPPDLHLTVFTNSLPIAVQLAQSSSVEVIVAGGKLFKDSQVTFGNEVMETFRSIRADVCFVGVCSLHHEIGLSVPNREEAQVKRAMINASAQVVALAIAEKIGTAETFIVGELRDIDVLVTDSAAPVEVLQWYTRSGIEVL